MPDISEIKYVTAYPVVDCDGTISVVVELETFGEDNHFYRIDSIIPGDRGTIDVQEYETEYENCGESSAQAARERETARVLADYGEDAALEHVRNGRP